MAFTFERFLEVAIRAIDMLTFILGFNKNNNNWPLHFVLIGHYTLAIIMDSYRSNLSQILFKTSVLKNFSNFTGKHREELQLY